MVDAGDRTFCLQVIALIFANLIGLWFDGNWIGAALGLDAAMFGYHLGQATGSGAKITSK